MKRQVVILSLAAACLTANSTLLAADRLVPSQYPTIQAAIDAAVNGDVVIIDPNTYTGPGNKNLNFGGKAITVRSIDPNDPAVVAATVIDCQNSGRGFYFHSGEEANSVLAGFTIKRGRVWGNPAKGGGILCSGSSPKIKNCVITSNQAFGHYGYPHGGSAFGGGMYFSSSSTTVIRCTIIGNTTEGGRGSYVDQSDRAGDGGNGEGAGVYCESNSTVTVRNCIFRGNRARGGDGGDGGFHPVWGPVGGGDGGHAYGGGVYCSENSPVEIIGCSMYANEAVRGNGGDNGGSNGISRGGGVYGGEGIENCILWANTASSSLQIYGGPLVSYSDVQGGYMGEGNIDSDPCFLDPTGGDYHLRFDSPCVDAGDPTYVPVPGETDIEGDDRIINGRIDIGADEFNPQIPFLEISPVNFEFEALQNGPNSMPQILSVSNTKGGILTWMVTEDCSWMEVDPNNGQCTDEIDEVALNINISGLLAGFYNCELTINADGALNSPQIATANLRIYDEDGVLKVPSDYSTIQAAIDAAQPGDSVVVAKGTYTGAGNKNLDFRGKAITVRSIDPQDPCVVADTVIDCQNSGRGFYFRSGEEANSVLAGFTIKRGRVGGNPAKGGGILCSGSSPTIMNCIIAGNQALGSYGNPHGKSAYGGGVYCESNSYLTLIDCTVSSNRAQGGHGDDLWCSPMSGCSGGMGNGAGGYGGGIYGSSDSSLVIVDCIIRDNSASGGSGGVAFETGEPIAYADGGVAGGGGLYGELAVSNCTIRDNEVLRGSGGGIPHFVSGGGGICCIGSSSIHNCLIVNNNMPDFWGSAVYIRSGGPCQISNCTVSDNTSDYHDTCAVHGNAEITDSIIWGHGGRDVGGCSITYSCLEQSVSGSGNIHDDPYFVTGPEGDYYLSQIAAGQTSDSPCVDAGSDTAANLGMDIFTTRTDETDDEDIVDMGYHYPTFTAGGIRIGLVQYPTIQAAIDAAINGDTVIVGPSIFTGPGNRDIDFKGKAITVRSIDPEDPSVVAATIINCNGSKAYPHRGFYFHSGEGPNSVISGLTITNGYVYDANGGGIYCSGSSPTIRNCTVSDNIAYGRNGICCFSHNNPDCESERLGRDCRGGGIFCTANSNPVILRCTIANNEVWGGVGGRYSVCAGPYWQGDGGEGHGGGIHCEAGSSPSIIECKIMSNKAFGGVSGDWSGHKSADAFGGGVSCILGSNPSIAACDISSNEAHGGDGGMEGQNATQGGDAFGGGIYCDNSSYPVIRACKIELNEALGGPGGSSSVFFVKGANAGHGSGGGIYSNSAVNLIIENCTISGNTASGGDGGLGGKFGVHLMSRGGDACGGGLALANGLFENVSNCIIVGNVARGGGGGNDDYDDTPRAPGDGGNAFGGGVYWILSTNSSIRNCSVCDNATWGGNGGCTLTGPEWVWVKAAPDGDERGAGVYCDDVLITNSIVWGNDANDANQVDGSGLSVSYCCVEQVISGPGNISADPCFVTGPNGEYYLSQIAAGQAVDSPCVDAGSDTAVNLGMDIFTTRTDETDDEDIVDMGYHYSAITERGNPDIDGDGDVDFFDYAWFAMGWPYGMLNQIPRGSVGVDGDLGEWTEGVEWRELDKVYYANPNDVSEARFALKWNPDTNKIYAAVIVHDSDHVFLDEYVYWDRSDRLEIYTQGDAVGGSGWLGTYDVAQQYYVAPNSTGGYWATWAYGQTLAEDAGLEYAVTVDGDQIIYEVGVRMFDNYGGISGQETVITNLSQGHVVGFDLVNCTRWTPDGFGMLSENMMTGKSVNADQFARYVLVEKLSLADLDGNGVIDFDDLRILVESWLWGK